MDRRNFFKIISASSAALGACGGKGSKAIPLLVPEHEIVPGEEQWHPAVCAGCGAGCATVVRIMEGIRTVERNGEKFRERIAAIKKIEGNPLDPISGGRLCARGQASVQSLYHPDRLRGPMKRTGPRGHARFAAVSWNDAVAQVAEKLAQVRSADPAGIVFLARGQAGTRSLAITRFTEALGCSAPVFCSIADHEAERKAAEMVFGWNGLPVYDLSRAYYTLGVGADFLGGWASPVYYARQFGEFRQGRRQIRGQLVQAESRLSITAAAADRWLPLRPGTEPQFLAAVGSLLLDGRLARDAEALPKPVAQAFQEADPARLLAGCGLDEKRVRQIVQELGESEAPLVLAGASIPQTNSVEAIVASHYVNLMLGNMGKPGGVLPPSGTTQPPGSRAIVQALSHARVVFIDGANPVYTMPRSVGVAEALARAELVVSFGAFPDDSSAWADILMPDHHELESEMALLPAVSVQQSVAVSTPFVEPLYDTRAVETTLAELATKIGAECRPVTPKDIVQPLLAGSITYDDVAREGGIWLDPPPPRPARPNAVTLDFAAARFEGDPAQYPYHFQPYLSLQFQDGSGAHLPWLQELPDPTSSSIWGLPVEIDPGTARKLQVANGDMVRVESPYGSLEAPAYVHPGAVPGVVSMAIGDGHAHFTRYASGRGANPLSILAAVWETSTGALASGATRVRLARTGGRRGLTQFSTEGRQERGFAGR
jgi:menaquinone reductase, molybdopterin-binding-like subunit